MEADFARYYALDFADYYRGRMTLRRVWALLRWLPADAAVWVAQRQDVEKAQEQQKVGEVEDALAMFR